MNFDDFATEGSDFAEAMQNMGVEESETYAPEPLSEARVRRVARLERPQTEPQGFDSVNLVGVFVQLAREQAGITIEPKRLNLDRPHACHLCLRAREEQPGYRIEDCERIVVSGFVYWAWACKFHVDMEWSRRFQDRLAKATGSEKDRLMAQKLKRQQSGRRVF